MKQLDRSLATIVESKIEIDHTKLDIFDTLETPIPDWEPQHKPKSFSELKGWYLDIETWGLDPCQHAIVMIGLINNQGEQKIIPAYENEAVALVELFQIITRQDNEFLGVFNGFKLLSHDMGFDLWFIEERCKILGLTSPFFKAKQPTTHRTAQFFGKPVQYYGYWLNYGKTAVIDLFHQLLAWDFVARKLTAYNLKSAPMALGLRTEERLVLSYEEMLECYNSGDWETIERYLRDDLVDTKLIGDFLLPAIWYEKIYLPDWKFQSLSTGGNGSKWNSIIENHYSGAKPETDPKLSFQGALTSANLGLFYNCIKLDAESLYPHMMLLYGIHSKKDPDAFLLSVMNYMLKYRVGLKRKKEDKTITTEEKQIEATTKVKLNSGYGGLATSFIEYNDMIAAAFVTAYGRATYQFIFDELVSLGYSIITSDTDGLFLSLGKDWQGDLEKEGKRLETLITEALPGNETYKVKVKFEDAADAVWIPPNLSGEASKKNYLVFWEGECISKKGKYKKRERSILERRFHVEYLELLVYQGLPQATEYYDTLVASLESGKFPIDELEITRKIKVNEVTLPKLGIGDPGTVQTWYIGLGATPTKEGAYDKKHYCKLLKKQLEEIQKNVKTI